MRIAVRPPSVVTRDAEFVEAQMLHHLYLILRHTAEGIVHVVGRAARFVAVAVTTKVGAHHCEMFREARRDQVPMHMGQRVAVQQQNRRAVATVAQVDFDLRVAGLNLGLFEAFEHARPRSHYHHRHSGAGRNPVRDTRRFAPPINNLDSGLRQNDGVAEAYLSARRRQHAHAERRLRLFERLHQHLHHQAELLFF